MPPTRRTKNAAPVVACISAALGRAASCASVVRMKRSNRAILAQLEYFTGWKCPVWPVLPSSWSPDALWTFAHGKFAEIVGTHISRKTACSVHLAASAAKASE